MCRILGALAVVLALSSAAPAADVAALVQRVKSVGPDGAGKPEAAAAWKELSRLGPDSLVALLTALDGASPAAANWLRSAVDAIVERERAANRPLPAKDLEAFLRDIRHDGKARRLA